MSILSIDSPVLTQEQFAKRVGLEPDVIRGMIERNQLPSKKYGKRRLVNVAAITADCLREAGITISPEQTQEQ